MELKIIDKKEQAMLSRIEVTGKLSFTGATPSSAEVKKQLSSELKVGEDLIVVKSIYTHFGSGNADLMAYAYLNKEDMGKIEPKPKKDDKKGAKPAEGAEKKEAAPAAAKPAEAPKEEKKEEAPKEEKKEEAPKEEGK